MLKGVPMRCPTCGNPETKVIDSRPYDENSSIRRRRECLDCGHRFTTYEKLSDITLFVTKSDGSTEPYDRDKLLRGLLIACAKRPVSAVDIENLIDGIESEIWSNPKKEVSSKQLGEMALDKLLQLDDVAYIRFASVYKDFKSVEEFMQALQDIR
jgi:transcriptional repressor NrdR